MISPNQNQRINISGTTTLLLIRVVSFAERTLDTLYACASLWRMRIIHFNKRSRDTFISRPSVDQSKWWECGDGKNSVLLLLLLLKILHYNFNCRKMHFRDNIPLGKFWLKDFLVTRPRRTPWLLKKRNYSKR